MGLLDKQRGRNAGMLQTEGLKDSFVAKISDLERNKKKRAEQTGEKYVAEIRLSAVTLQSCCGRKV